MNLLIARSDPVLVDVLKPSFEAEHFSVDVVHLKRHAISLLQRREYDAAIVDLDMPTNEGISILRFVRDKYQALPVLVLAGCATVAERVRVLDSGADDFVQKPFAFCELSARIRAVMRRGHRSPQAVLRFQDLELNRVERTATRAGREIALTPREFSLLEYLMQHQGHRTTRAEIIEHVWKLSGDTLTNVVDVYINYLRRKIDTEENCKLIRTIRGVGYQLYSSTSLRTPAHSSTRLTAEAVS